jgi:hypothetical protein
VRVDPVCFVLFGVLASRCGLLCALEIFVYGCLLYRDLTVGASIGKGAHSAKRNHPRMFARPPRIFPPGPEWLPHFDPIRSAGTMEGRSTPTVAGVIRQFARFSRPPEFV